MSDFGSIYQFRDGSRIMTLATHRTHRDYVSMLILRNQGVLVPNVRGDVGMVDRQALGRAWKLLDAPFVSIT